jgi:hypothetical protein
VTDDTDIIWEGEPNDVRRARLLRVSNLAALKYMSSPTEINKRELEAAQEAFVKFLRGLRTP